MWHCKFDAIFIKFLSNSYVDEIAHTPIFMCTADSPYAHVYVHSNVITQNLNLITCRSNTLASVQLFHWAHASTSRYAFHTNAHIQTRKHAIELPSCLYRSCARSTLKRIHSWDDMSACILGAACTEKRVQMNETQQHELSSIHFTTLTYSLEVVHVISSNKKDSHFLVN